MENQPENSAPALDGLRQEKAREYARIQRRWMLVDLTIGMFYLIFWLMLGWNVHLREILTTWTGSQFLLVLLFGLIFGGFYQVISLPLSYYTGYILPHRYETSNQTHKGWIMDQIKSAAMGAVLGGLVIEVVYWILRSAPGNWWLFTWLFLFVFSVLLANLAPVLLMPIFNKFTLLSEEYAELSQRLIRLAERANVQVQGVFTYDMSRRTKAANAALTGLGNTRRIILGDTLLKEFTADEIEGVLAHELGHQAHQDMLLLIAFGGFTNLIGLALAAWVFQWGSPLVGVGSAGDVAGMPLLALMLGIFGLISSPLENTFSRWREKLADDYALQTTGRGDVLAAAFTRLANQNLSEVDPEPWVELLLYSHPSLARRIARARAYAASHN